MFVATTALNLTHGKSFEYISTGNDELDSLLNGGVRRGELLEISGPSGSGKTQLVMALSVTCKGPSIIIDTSHGICPQRMAEIASFSQVGSTDSLRNIDIVDIHDIFELYDKLETIASSTTLVVVDCISIFIATEFGKGYAAQAAIESVTKMLRSIARDYNTAVVVTNGVVSDRRSNGTGTKPALGRVWSFAPDRRLMLSDEYQAPQRCQHAEYRAFLQVNARGVCLQGT
jgi:RAD51-like protein 3